MTRDEFAAAAAAYGADLARWPEALRIKAEPVAGSDWALTILSKEAGVDGLFATRTEVAPARVGRAVAGVQARIAPRPGIGLVLRRWLVPASGLATAGVVGMMVGLWLPTGPAPAELDAVGHLFAATLALSDPALLEAMGG